MSMRIDSSFSLHSSDVCRLFPCQHNTFRKLLHFIIESGLHIVADLAHAQALLLGHLNHMQIEARIEASPSRLVNFKGLRIALLDTGRLASRPGKWARPRPAFS